MAEQIEILVVDDDKEIANLVEIYLSSTGYKIHKAYNAVDGLALLQKYDIKLAIIDVMMPQIDALRCAVEFVHAEYSDYYIKCQIGRCGQDSRLKCRSGRLYDQTF